MKCPTAIASLALACVKFEAVLLVGAQSAFTQAKGESDEKETMQELLAEVRMLLAQALT